MSAIVAACLLLMELTGQNQTFDNKSLFQIIFMFIAPIFVWFFGIKERKQELKGKLTWKQGLTQGFKISLVYGIVSPFVFFIYYTLINPSIISFVAQTYGLTGQPDALVIAFDMGAQFVFALFFGTIYAAIISFFLKTK